MKQIALIVTPITNSQAPGDFRLDYRREFLRLMEVASDGITVAEMALALRIAAKLNDAPGGELILDDAEWEYLRDKLLASRWNFAAPEIISMVESVEKASEAAV